MNKFYLNIIVIFILYTPLYAIKPIIGVTGVNAGSIRIVGIANDLENQLINVINATGSFNIINPALLKDQLTRYNCVEENCTLGFAESAGINILIKAYVEDKGSSLIFNIYSQGINAPYFGDIIYKYRAEIPISGLNLSTKEYNLIAEEHAAYFISGLLKKFQSQVLIKKNSGLFIDSDENISGTFDLYRYEDALPDKKNIRLFRSIGKIKLKIKRSFHKAGFHLKKNDFIFINYSKKADFITDLFYGRKRELVFAEESPADTAIIFFSTIPISVIMPVLAPLGYYKNNDFTGLSLWTINTLPYLYLEYNGLKDHLNFFKDDNNNSSRKAVTQYRFGLYMLLCGGIPLTIDAFSNRMLDHAAGYEKQSYLGNNYTAVYLSIISGGGGFFYKGYRPEGYLYFHLNNILLYLCISEFSDGKTYHSESGTYTKDRGNRQKAKLYLGMYGALKIIEITHVILLKDNIRNGKIEEVSGFEPAVYSDRLGVNMGIQYTFRY